MEKLNIIKRKSDDFKESICRVFLYFTIYMLIELSAHVLLIYKIVIMV